MAHHPAHEHLLAALLESSEEAVVSVSFEGVIETWSAGAERLYGYSAGEIIGQSLSCLLPLDEIPLMKHLHSTNGNVESKSIEIGERLHKNGSRILLGIRRNLIRSEIGDAEGVLEIAQALDPHEAFWSPEEAPLRLLVDQVPGFLWTTDRNLKISSHWGTGVHAAKIRPGSLVGQSIYEFLGAADQHATPIAEHRAALQGPSRALSTLGRAACWRYAWGRCVPAPAKSSDALARQSTSRSTRSPKNKLCIKRGTMD